MKIPHSASSAAALMLLAACGKTTTPSQETMTETFSVAPIVEWTAQQNTTGYLVKVTTRDGLEVIHDHSQIARYVPAQGLPPGDYTWTAEGISHESTLVSRAGQGVLRILEFPRSFHVPADADVETIRAIVREAASSPPARIVFPRNGVFRFDPGPVFLELRSTGPLLLEGRGTRFVFTNPMSGFAKISDSTDICFRDLIIEHDPPPFTVGEMVAISADTTEVRILPGHPPLDAPHFSKTNGFGVFLDPNVRGRMLDGSPLVVNVISEEPIPGGFLLRFSGAPVLNGVKPGDRFVRFSRSPGGQSLFVAERSPGLVFLNITNHSISGGHYLLLECDAARILGCKSEPATGLAFGGNADGAHVRSSRIGPWIEGNTFDSIGDDGVAIFAKGIQLLHQPAPDVLVMSDRWFNLEPGDQFLLFNPREGCSLGDTHTVKTIEADGDGHRVTFSPPLETRIEVSSEDPWRNDQAFNVSARHEGFVIRRNTFRSIRRYGVIVRGSGGVIADNSFEGISDAAITLRNEPAYWQNGLHSERIRIENNRILNCNFSAGAHERGAIHIALRQLRGPESRWGDAPSSWRGHREIQIMGNNISGWRCPAMHLANVDGLTVLSNTFADQKSANPPAAAIVLTNVANESVSDNHFSGLLTGTRPLLQTPAKEP